LKPAREGRSGAVSRRHFVERSALGAVSALVPTVLSAGPMERAAEPEPFELEEMTVAQLAKGMDSGRFTARSMAAAYLQRIERVDRQGPAVNAVIEVNPEALAVAEELDRERRARGPRTPLHGIPVLIKDNIGTHDRMMTTAGSLALAGSIPPRDAFVAKRLREVGAVILGKTNLSEWANLRSGHSTSGWSGRGGLTRNPYALDRNPCGSSSGSGVAVAANLCVVAVGTETDGSVVCPSSANGIVGIKPTVGLVSRAGIIPIAHSQDTAGSMARTVADAVLLLGALAGVDPADPATGESRDKALTDYTPFLDPKGLRGKRLGVVRKLFGFNDEVDRLMNEALQEMKRQGAEIIDPAEIETLGKFDESELEVLLYEFKADLNSYLAFLGRPAPVHSLREIIEFNERNREKEMLYFGQDLLIKAEAKGPLTDKAYLEALEKDHRLARTEGIDAVMDKFHLDALVAPTAGPAWTTDLVTGDHSTGGSSTPPAVAGYPNINVPLGLVFGLPVGVSFFGRAWSEPVLIQIACGFEQATRQRRPPKFLLTADVTVHQ
jgi:amidase